MKKKLTYYFRPFFVFYYPKKISIFILILNPKKTLTFSLSLIIYTLIRKKSQRKTIPKKLYILPYQPFQKKLNKINIFFSSLPSSDLSAPSLITLTIHKLTVIN